MKNVLAIAGLDPSGCAGISADLKTFLDFSVHGLAVVTAITAQNTQKVEALFGVNHETIRDQLKSIVADIEVHAVKIGLMPDSTTIEFVSRLCEEYKLTNIVVDPILRSTTGYSFGDADSIEAYKRFLFPIADVISPNLQEASLLTGNKVLDVRAMKRAAEDLHKTGAKNVIVTGGHLEESAVDILYDGEKIQEFAAPKVQSENGRGTGCIFSSIIAIYLARAQSVATAIEAAKKYISEGLLHSYKIGKGRGPLGRAGRG